VRGCRASSSELPQFRPVLSDWEIARFKSTTTEVNGLFRTFQGENIGEKKEKKEEKKKNNPFTSA
jgi:hypothetical protein